jgi:hypothetical protein
MMTTWFITPVIATHSVRPDFTVFWAAAHFALTSPHKAYDSVAMGVAQAWARPPSKGPRIFAYPPTALLLLAPWGLLPFWTAYFSWIAMSVAAFWSAVRRVTSGWAVPLSLVLPHPILVLILGQTTLFASAAAIWAISLLNRRPAIAGVMFGVAAALKPQSVFLVPLVFLRIRAFHSAIAAACTLGGLSVASLMLGPGLWRSWLQTMETLPIAIAGYHLDILGATPRMAATALGWTGAEVAIIQVTGVVAGAGIVWAGFGSRDLLLRVQSLAVGCLLASPYAMRYDIAMMAPVLATAIITAAPRDILVALPVFAMNAVAIIPAIIISGVTSLFERSSVQPCCERVATSAHEPKVRVTAAMK